MSDVHISLHSSPRVGLSKKFWPFFFGLCVILQAGLLIYFGQLPMEWAAPLGLLFLGLGHFLRLYLQSPERNTGWSLLLSMLALGNVGMIVGWAGDFGFQPLISEGMCLCGCPLSPLGQGLISKFGWMYKGMILASIPTFFIYRPNRRLTSPISFSMEVIHAVACLVCMTLGMFAGCKLLSSAPITDPYEHFVLTYAVITCGMTAGMLLPCLLWNAYLSSKQIKCPCS